MSSFEYYPENARSVDNFEWRTKLQENDLVDCCDTTQIWYNSTVLETRISKNSRDEDYLEIFIGKSTTFNQKVTEFMPKTARWKTKEVNFSAGRTSTTTGSPLQIPEFNN